MGNVAYARRRFRPVGGLARAPGAVHELMCCPAAIRRLLLLATASKRQKGEDKSLSTRLQWGTATFSLFGVFDGHGVRGRTPTAASRQRGRGVARPVAGEVPWPLPGCRR